MWHSKILCICHTVELLWVQSKKPLEVVACEIRKSIVTTGRLPANV